jgi:hypothetical protein
MKKRKKQAAPDTSAQANEEGGWNRIPLKEKKR